MPEILWERGVADHLLFQPRPQQKIAPGKNPGRRLESKIDNPSTTPISRIRLVNGVSKIWRYAVIPFDLNDCRTARPHCFRPLTPESGVRFPLGLLSLWRGKTRSHTPARIGDSPFPGCKSFIRYRSILTGIRIENVDPTSISLAIEPWSPF